MTALTVLDLCRYRSVELVPDGGRLLLRGAQAARDELRESVRGRKLELLAALKSHQPAMAGQNTTGEDDQSTYGRSENAKGWLNTERASFGVRIQLA